MTVPSSPELVSSVVLASAGGEVSLRAAPWLLTNPTGISGTAAEPVLDELPGVDGAFVRGADEDRAGLTLEPAQVILAATVDAGSPALTAAEVSRVRTLLNSRRHGAAELRVTRPGEPPRTLAVRHVPAAEDFAPPRHGGSGWRVVIRLIAPRPLWAGARTTVGPWLATDYEAGNLPVDLPWSLASGRVLVAVTGITVAGDEITWPVIDVTGPASSWTVTRGDGRRYGVTPPAPLTAGQVARVRHDPLSILTGAQVEGPGGVSWDQYLDDGSDLFEVRPGTEALAVDVAGAGPATAVSGFWDAQHWSALT